MSTISTSSRIEGRTQLVPSASALTVIDDVCVDLLDDLRTAVLSREGQARSRSAPTLNQGGWRSDEIFSWAEPCVAQLLFDLRWHIDARISRGASRGEDPRDVTRGGVNRPACPAERGRERPLYDQPRGGVNRPACPAESPVDGRVRPLTMTGWAMINRLGSYHPSHRHDGSLLSGVYCVDPGSTPGSPGVPTIFESSEGEITVPAAPGRLTMFPGQFYHRVPPCEGQAPRITIAFDVKR